MDTLVGTLGQKLSEIVIGEEDAEDAVIIVDVKDYK